MGKLVEGLWNQFEFRLATPIYYQSILEHLRNNFYREELVSQLLGYSKDTSLNFEQKIVSYLAQNLSFIAVDTKSNQVINKNVNLNPETYLRFFFRSLEFVS